MTTVELFLLKPLVSFFFFFLLNLKKKKNCESSDEVQKGRKDVEIIDARADPHW